MEFEELRTLIGEEIKKRRQRMNLTQQALANKLGISRAWWTMMEKTNPPVQIDTLLKVCDALKCELPDFLNSIYGLKMSPAKKIEDGVKTTLTKALKNLGVSAEVSVVLKSKK